MRLERVRGALPSNGMPIGVATATTSLVRYERDARGPLPLRRPSARRWNKNAAVNTCDGASVQIRNGGTTPVFVYVFALDDSWMLHPLNNVCRQGAQNRLDIGGTRTVDLQYRNGSIAPGLAPRTRNGVLVFAVPFEPGVALPVDPCRFVRAMTDGTRGTDEADDPVDRDADARTDTRSRRRPVIDWTTCHGCGDLAGGPGQPEVAISFSRNGAAGHMRRIRETVAIRGCRGRRLAEWHSPRRQGSAVRKARRAAPSAGALPPELQIPADGGATETRCSTAR